MPAGAEAKAKPLQTPACIVGAAHFRLNAVRERVQIVVEAAICNSPGLCKWRIIDTIADVSVVSKNKVARVGDAVFSAACIGRCREW